MTQTWRISLALMLILLIGLPPLYAQAEDQQKTELSASSAQQVLLLYDSLALGTSKEGNVETLQRLLASFRIQVTLLSTDNYVQGQLRNYSRVIVVHNNSDLALNPDLTADLVSYTGSFLFIGADAPASLGTAMKLHTAPTQQDSVDLDVGNYRQSALPVHTTSRIEQAEGTAYGTLTWARDGVRSPYAVSDGHFGYAPYFEKGNLNELAMASLLRSWLHADSEGNAYVLIKEVYPISDLSRLRRMADEFYEAGIPFLVSVRPVFNHLDDPAMKRYLETLRYMQARNGNILVDSPFVASTYTTLDNDTLKNKMALFLDAMAAYGVAPLGISSPLYWAYDRRYSVEGMGFFDSAVLLPNEETLYLEPTDTSRSFSSALFTMPMSQMLQWEREGKRLAPLPTDVAFTYNFFADDHSLDAAVQELSDSWILFSDYKNTAHSTRTAAHSAASVNGGLIIDGGRLALSDDLHSIASDYSFKQVTGKQSFSRLFNIQNQIFIAIIGFTLLIFGLFFYVGYRMYKRKYYL